MLVPLNCFSCKQKVSVEVTREDIHNTSNSRHVVNVSCPNLKSDGSVCGRKMTSLIGKSQYSNILNIEESIKSKEDDRHPQSSDST
jgi:hypothetical protein